MTHRLVIWKSSLRIGTTRLRIGRSEILKMVFLFSLIGSSIASVIEEKTIQARIIFVKTFKLTCKVIIIWSK